MNTDPKARDLFIVDNSISGWTGLRYLEEWAGIAKSFDVATGYFEIGSLLALDGKWQGLEKIRILMGGEITFRTRKLMLDAVKSRALANLDVSIEADKEANPFLGGVPAILAALKSGQIECRVYDKNKFHAKAYITHAKLEVIGSQALVGSSNFTRPGLTQNIELNVQIQSAREVGQLQEWFESHWNEATDVTESVVETIARQIRPYSPFDVYAKALQEFFRGHELTDEEWDQTRSRMFPKLDRYQKEAYWALMKIASQHRGAFLCDGVGLGKTFVGLMLIERLVLHEGKRVVLFAPKAAKESVWEPHLRAYLSHIGGIGGSADFSNLAVFSHTDLGRTGEFPERFRRIAELADAVIIDEAHHFRNPGSKRENAEGDPSRYYKLYDLLDSSARPKSLFMLTATPINNRISDFRHMAELFTRRVDDYFGRTLGVNNLTAHFNKLEKDLRAKVGGDAADLTEHLPEALEILSSDEIFRQLVVQRSRAYARESQIRETGTSAVFPVRNEPQVAEYSIKKTYGRLLDMVEQAFQKVNPLFTLSIYYPLAYYKGSDTDIKPLDEGRQRQVVSLIRTQFLKRFESSVWAFELSCDRLMKKLLAFVQVHSESESEKKRLERWKNQNAEILGYAAQRELQFWGSEDQDDPDEDIVPQELLDAVEELDPNEYKVSEMIQETFLDLDQIVNFLEEARKFDPKNDDKLQKLIRLLKQKDLAGQKVLIFTEFADTARYLLRQLREAGIEGVAQIDSATKGHRDAVIQRFSPYYNGKTSAALKASGQEEIRILISTDVLSEGLNLQDASRMINYDIHWNPVRLMQRIGRVDRRMNPAIEEQLIRDHPGVKESRGKVSFWNFLPPAELNKLLTLFTTVTRKTLLISKTFGIEGKKLLTPKDDYDSLKEFNHAYEGTKNAVEKMHLEYQDLIQTDPELEARLRLLPGATFSGRQRVADGVRGIFFCYALPALDKELGEFTLEAGTTRWYLYDLDQSTVREEPSAIVDHIRSTRETPRKCTAGEATLIDIRAKVEKHIKNGYLKRIDAPIGVKPALKCWMELSDGQ
jgi:ERCC4-like helicases